MQIRLLKKIIFGPMVYIYIVILDSGLVTEIGVHVILMRMVMKKVTIKKNHYEGCPLFFYKIISLFIMLFFICQIKILYHGMSKLSCSTVFIGSLLNHLDCYICFISEHN